MHDDYMNTEELAKIIGVSKSLVEKWRRKGLLMPDVIGHGKNRRGGVYYYSKERVQQLASVYEPKLRTGFHREKVIKYNHEKRLFRASELPD